MVNQFEDFCDEIFVLSLDRCNDRKDHILKLFEEKGIEKFAFFKGVDYTEDVVQDAKRNGFLKMDGLENCIRCGKNVCVCKLPKKQLMDTEIANWLSFISIFEYLKKNNVKKCLVMEDDIVFTNKGLEIMNEVLNQDFFKKNGIDLEKPLILRIGCGFNDKYHISDKKPHLTNEIRMSNPCLFVNDKFVDFFLSKWKPICYTSDMFLHKKILEMSDGIQHFSVNPSPIYEMSWGSRKKIKSLIRDIT